MSKLVLDHNPLSGETIYFSFNDHDDQVVITHEQDVTSYLRDAHYMATDAQHTRDGISHDMWHYAHVPNNIIIEMKQKHGVDFFDRNDAPKVFKLLNDEYRQFKTTQGHHSIKHG